MGRGRTSEYDARTWQYKNEFVRNNYDRINLTVPKGTKDRIMEYIEDHGFRSVNDFIGFAIAEAIDNKMTKSEDGSILYPTDAS